MHDRENQSLATNTLTMERRRKTAKTSKTSEYCIYRFVCIFYAALFFVFSAALVFVGAKSLADSRVYADAKITDIVFLSSYLVMAAGASAVVTPFLGLYAVIRQCARLVKVFAALAMFFIVALSIIAIQIFLSRNQSIDLTEFEDNLYLAGKKLPDLIYLNNLNYIQKENSCCGLKGPQTFDKQPNFHCLKVSATSSCELPESCFMKEKAFKAFDTIAYRTLLAEHAADYTSEQWKKDVTKLSIYYNGCEKPIKVRMNEFLFNMGIVVVVICLLNIIGMFFLTMLIMKMGDRKHLFNTNKDRSATAML